MKIKKTTLTNWKRNASFSSVQKQNKTKFEKIIEILIVVIIDLFPNF